MTLKNINRLMEMGCTEVIFGMDQKVGHWVKAQQQIGPRTERPTLPTIVVHQKNGADFAECLNAVVDNAEAALLTLGPKPQAEPGNGGIASKIRNLFPGDRA